MIGSRNRFVVALCAVIGVALLAIAYTGAGTSSSAAYALRILLATLTVIVAGHALIRWDVPLLLIAAGLVAWSVDTFNPHSILAYIGIALFLGGFFLMRRRGTVTPRDTGG